MCLEISTIHHPDLEPLVAEEDIEVVKFLKLERCEFSENNISKIMLNYDTYEIVTMTEPFLLITPYMSYPVEFDENDECVMEHHMSTFGGLCIEGIHAYTKNAWYFDRDLLLTCEPFRAYIPKGTEYYLGRAGDIVADKMIIENKIYEEENGERNKNHRVDCSGLRHIWQ